MPVSNHLTTQSARRASIAVALLWAGCASAPSFPDVPRAPWTSVEALLGTVRSWPLATSNKAPWAFHVLMPKKLSQPDLLAIHDAFESRGYHDPHASPSVVAELTEMVVRLVLADPVTLRVETRAAAEELWLAGIPFGTTVGNSLWLTLPRRAIPAAKAALANIVPNASWREW